jgi:DNA repair exonuclease SbcCD nuclease subunit
VKLLFTHCWHLTGYVPTCRIEDKVEWLQFQYDRMLEVVNYANTKDAELVIAGDLFDQPRVDDEVITLFLQAMHLMINPIHIIGGNHSLPEHREANIDRSSLGIIKAVAGDRQSKIYYHVCDEALIDGRFEHSYKLNDDVTLVHTLAVDADEIPFSWKAITASELADKFDTPWILVGDNHKHFDVTHNNKRVLSAGCLIAETVSENDYDLGVYFIDTGNKVDVTTQADPAPVYRVQKSTVEYLPIFHDKELISRAHIKEKPSDEALQAMIAVFAADGVAVSIDFVRNLFTYIVQNTVSSGAVSVIESIRDTKESV